MSGFTRATDTGITAWNLRDAVWARCPRCAGPAKSVPDDAATCFKVACRSCAYNDVIPFAAVHESIGDDTDGRFGLPLYLAADVRGGRPWAYNLEHLDLLIAWIGADLRERQNPTPDQYRNRTMMSRLPGWMKAASARPRILKALGDLRERAIRDGLR